MTPDDMIQLEKPDVVVVATPPLTHPQLCLLALENGCHVFCEKPFMPSVEDADEVIALAEKKNRVVVINNQYYQMPMYRTVNRLLEGGQPGRLYHINVWQQMYQIPDSEGGWKAALQPNRVLYEFATHALDLICQFFQAYPLSVTARTPKVRPGVDADVLVLMRLDFPGDRVATIHLNRVSHAPKRYIEMRLDCEEASLRLSQGGVARLEMGWNSASPGGQPGRLYHINVWQQMYQIPDSEGGWKAALQPNRVLYEFATHALDLICQFFQAYPVKREKGDLGGGVSLGPT